MIKNIVYILIAFFTASCTHGSTQDAENNTSQNTENLKAYKKAYFASGCFWCVEAVFESVKGVKEAVSGYAGGNTPNPTYQKIGTGTTGHAEAVEVYYDPEVVSFETLVKVFFGSHDPTTLNYQGPDHGTQYRSIAFYQTEEEKEIIQNYIQNLEEDKVYDKPIVTEVAPLKKFYPAEDYHQDYEKNHPDNPYVKGVSIPRLNRFKEKYPDLLKESEKLH